MLSCRCSQLRERSHFFNIRESVLVVSNKLKWHPTDAKLSAKLQKIFDTRKKNVKIVRKTAAIMRPNETTDWQSGKYEESYFLTSISINSLFQ